MTTIGKVKEITLEQERDFEWKIQNFESIPAVENIFYHSPTFSFAGATWYLRIYPNVRTSSNTDGYISLFLIRKFSDHPISLEYSLVMKSADENTDFVGHYSYVFEEEGSGHGTGKALKRSVFLEKISEFAPNHLTVICTLKHPISNDSSNVVTALCSYCKKTLDAEDIPYHENRCLHKPIKCPECCNVIELKDWYEHVCEVKKTKVYEKMVNNFKDIMISEEHSDTVIQVREVEFRLHRSILAARNTFFDAMFKNEMKEKVTGTVSINDCEPDVFRQFIHFIYTGEVEKMSEEIVCSLYEVADKYQDELLKEECLSFMVNTISVENVCEFIILAVKFSENKLLEKTKEFFISKPKEIVCHVKWLNFSKEYPIQANELVIKAFDHYVK